MPKNPVVFWELASHDKEKSAEFLDKVFDWDLKMNERLGFYTMDAGDGAGWDNNGAFTSIECMRHQAPIYGRWPRCVGNR